MTVPRTTTHLFAVVGGAGRTWDAAHRLLMLVPPLAERALVSARLGFRARLRLAFADLRIDAAEPRLSTVQQRLAFWYAREGGWARPRASLTDEDAERFDEAFARCDVSLRDLTDDRWRDSLARIFSRICSSPHDVPPGPELVLAVGGPAWESFRFDAPGSLFIPSPLAPPVGDVLAVSLRPVASGERSCRALGVVVSARRAAGASPGSPAGFTVALQGDCDEARALLAASCPPAGSDGARAAPRYRVVCAARLADPDEDPARGPVGHGSPALVANLSHRGAFVLTSRPLPRGGRIDLTLRLPGERDVRIPATVVRGTPRGVGLEFAPSGDEAALAAALAAVPGRARRVLVVDDDALVRRILVDAFRERGWDAITAADGDAGLRAITDELFTLDAVVTDVRMPGLAGDALVRAVRVAGGEEDLVLVVVSATVDDAFARQLVAAGADRVLPKDVGPGAVVAAVETAVQRRGVAAAAAPEPPASSPGACARAAP